jgi:cellulose synthase/poly-beta-1,6-N-acetylglucosamine synthase-like glycosyltransferase
VLPHLAHLVISGVVVLAVATMLVFTVRATRPARHPLAAALVGGFVVGAGIGVLLLLLGEGTAASLTGALALGATVPAWHRAARSWDVRGLAAWALTVDVGLLYLGYVALWTVTVHPGAASTLLSAVMWLLELFVFLIGIGYVWELVDVLARREWTAEPGPLAFRPEARRPFVSLHVPTHNEPPEMVIESLERMLRIDYDNYEILLVDNNTTDPALWRPLEEFCARHERITFIHLEDWPGYKSGALNHALTRVDPRTEVIGIVDADYHVDVDFLAHCAPLFNDPDVSFVQTPQDYRGWDISPYFERLYHSYGYFFDVSQRSRNERNGAIFGGTMGLIRRSALVEVGGWDEWCITEDAELSLRLLKIGTRGLHIDRAYGRGVMPLSFESLKGQRFRWCFGGIQILRMHWRSLLPGRPTAANRLTLGQRWAYLVGGLQWFGDLAGLAFTMFLLIGACDAALGSDLVVRRLSGLLLISTAALVVLGAIRSVALVRRTSGAGWRTAAGAFGLWLALGLTVARASWLGLVSQHGTFLRTPKVKGEPRPLDALRGNRAETVIAVVCLATATAAIATLSTAGLVVGALLAFQGAGFALAPVNSLAAIRTDLPDDLRRRRGWLPSWGSVAGQATRGGVVLVGAGAAFALFAVLASPVGGPGLADITRNGPPPASAGSPAPAQGGRPTHAATTPASTGTTPAVPSAAPTPGNESSATPSRLPTPTPTASQLSTARPTGGPTSRPSSVPSTLPTAAPSRATGKPSTAPTAGPTQAPTRTTGQPTAKPTGKPTQAGGPPTTSPSHP